MRQPVCSRDPIPKRPKCFRAEVRNLQIVTEYVVVIELNKRIEIDERLQTGKHHNHQDDLIDECVGIGDPPDGRANAPYHELDVAVCKGHPYSLPLRWKHPGIADVAI